MRDLDNHFGGYNHLVHLPRAAEALHLIRKAASCVKPLMRKRGWHVGLLSEFIPEQANLLGLNINRGQTIQIRLRYASDINQFLPFDQVLDTLLHELSHNVWGPHDENFHRLWNELRDEWETLQIRGFTGEGFLGKGQALGGHRIPVEEVRRKARVAAQERARLNKNKFNTGRRLGEGGNAVPPPQSRKRLRDMLVGAAQSRTKANTTKVDSGCATGTQAGTKAADDALRNGFRTKAEMDDANSIAIATALQELYEQEEDDRIFEGLAGPPAPGGLTWDPELGLQPVAAPPKPPASAPPLLPTQNGSSSRSSTSTSTSRRNQSSTLEFNPHGVPVSRLVREAEANRQRQSDNLVFTPAVQNWPTSETGANFGSNLIQQGRPTSSESDAGGGAWGCPQCTFNNHAVMATCEICSAPRPARQKPTVPRKPVPATTYAASSHHNGLAENTKLGWSCNYCDTWMESQWWTCAQCGMMKHSS